MSNINNNKDAPVPDILIQMNLFHYCEQERRKNNIVINEATCNYNFNDNIKDLKAQLKGLELKFSNISKFQREEYIKQINDIKAYIDMVKNIEYDNYNVSTNNAKGYAPLDIYIYFVINLKLNVSVKI